MAEGTDRLVEVLRAPPRITPNIGAEQTPRVFRMAVVTAIAPLTVKFNNDPLSTVAGIPSINSYGPVVGNLVVVGVFEGGAMVVLGSVTATAAGVPTTPPAPWAVPWGVLAGANDATQRGSSANSGAGLVVFPPQSFTCAAKRLLKVSWHSSYNNNADAGANTLIVQFANGATGAVIQNAAVQTVAGGWTGPLSAFMYVQADQIWSLGPASVEVIATATAPNGFWFQYGTYGSYLIVEDVGPATPTP